AKAVPWEAERTHRLMEALRAGHIRYMKLDFRAASDLVQPRRTNSLSDNGLWCWVGDSGGPAANDATGRKLAQIIDRSPWLAYVPGSASDWMNQSYYWHAQLRGSILRLALLLYQCDHDGPAESLDVLVPTCLTSLPTDPYSGGGFR